VKITLLWDSTSRSLVHMSSNPFLFTKLYGVSTGPCPDLALDRDQWMNVANTVMSLRVP
jgi:hypothetical protein